MNVVDTPNNLLVNQLITKVENGYTIYATARATNTKTIPVKWSASNLICLLNRKITR